MGLSYSHLGGFAMVVVGLIVVAVTVILVLALSVALLVQSIRS